MDKTVIGIALFALVIVVGLIVGLRLSSPGPQRKAVGLAFGLMAIIAALFYICAMVFSLAWSAPVFAAAAIIIPIATYTLFVRHAKAPITVSRRNPNDPPRPPRNENRVGADQKGAPLEPSATGAPSRSAGDYYDDEEFDDIDDIEEPDYQGEYDVEDEEDDEPAELEPVSAELAEAFIDEYLVGENEIDDGFFEPEPSPTLRPHKEPDPIVSSSMVVTVPHPEGDERFLVVSESREPANPILAYRRTTSSHLVHLGVAKNGEDNEAPLIAAALAAQRNVAWTPEPVATQGEEFEFDMFEPEEARMPAPAPVAAVEEAASATVAAAASIGADEEAFEFERVPKHARAKHAPKAAVEAAPVAEAAPAVEAAPAAQPVFEATPAPAPEPVYAPAPMPVEPEPELELATPAPTTPAPEPTFAPAPEPAAAPDFSYSLETVFEPEPEVAPEPAYEPLSLFDLQTPEASQVIEPAEPAPAVEQPTAPAPQPAPAPTPQPAPAPKPQLTPFESYMAKAEGLRAKGVFAMAARIYNEAAVAADSTADNHRARFEEIACYVAAGQGEKAQAVAATLRASSVLTKVERFKLNAIERMA